jgi:hypothetical protein
MRACRSNTTTSEETQNGLWATLDFAVAQGLFEYSGDQPDQMPAEITGILQPTGGSSRRT